MRRIWASDELKGYIDFPYAEQVFRIERRVFKIKEGKTRTEIAYGITSLKAEEAKSERLLELNRGH